MLNGPGDVFASLTYPMAIVTASSPRERDGCLVGFHSQCSIDPPRYLVCISSQNRTSTVVAASAALAVHFVTRSDMALARLFGELSGDDVDKFAHCGWSQGPLGVPVLQHDGSWVAGPIVARHVVGDHDAVVIDAAYGGGKRPQPQLQYVDVTQLEPGHPA